jgi:hypothetical protein
LPNKLELPYRGISLKCSCGFDPFLQRITVGGASVGIAGLADSFRSWLASGKKAQDLTKEQIIQAIRKYNYIIPRLEDEYAEAIKARYAAYSQKSPQR